MASYSEVTIQFNDALRQLQIDTQGLTGQALKDELTAFIGRQSVEAEGKVTMLWAGESHDRTVKYGQIADQIAKNDDPNIRTLNKTVAKGLGPIRTIYGKGGDETLSAIMDIQFELPFPVLSFNTDNGTEFFEIMNVIYKLYLNNLYNFFVPQLKSY